MRYSKLGSSPLEVSRICLGTMTWGVQNNQKDADEQLAYALERGINFIDTAEMYAIPPSPETYGKTESIIGNWLRRNGEKRDQLIIATKIAGPHMPWVRNGGPITGEAVIQSVDASLKRLQTDYIDLYQLHWPNRIAPHFSRHWPGLLQFNRTTTEKQIAGIIDTLEGLKSCIDAGKIRYCGLSNETPWGIAQYIQLSKKYNLPRIISIQNEFSLIHLKDSPYLLESCIRDDVAYLPWSPLGGGMLSGKYLNGARPEGSRWTISQRHGLFRDTEAAQQAVATYKKIAEEAGITTAQLALAWCDQIEGVTSTITGATKMTQLKEDIDAFELELSRETIEAINGVIRMFPVPF